MMKSHLLAVVLLFFFFSGRAQSKINPADSIRVDNIWHQGVKKIIDFGQSQLAVDADSALRYFQYSIKVIDSLGLTPSFMYEAWMRIGEAYVLLHKIGTGKDYFMKVVRAYQAAHDKKREARTWLRMGIKLKYGNDKDAEIQFYYQNALALYQELNDKAKEAEVLQEMGIVYNLANRLDSAERSFLRAEEIYKAMKSDKLLQVRFSLCNLYRNMGDMNKSLSYALKNMSDLKERGDTTSIYYPVICLQLGAIHSDMGKWEKSVGFLRQSLDKMPAFFPADWATENAYVAMNDLVEALVATNRAGEAFTTASEFIDKYPPSGNTEKGFAAEIMGRAHAGIQQYDVAEKYFLQMMKFYRMAPHVNALGLAHWGPKVLREFYVQRHKYDKARQTFNTQFPNVPSGELPFSALMDDELAQYRIDSARRDFAAALGHFKRYKELSDSAFNATKSIQLAELEIKYETAQKENDIRQLKKDSQLQKEQVTQANHVRNLTLGGAALLIAFTCLLYNSYRLNRRKNRALHQLVVEKDGLLDEKEWLLKEIHHRVKNNLQIVMGLLQRQSTYVDNDAALSAIHASENRMHSISLIHQKLYQSDNLNLIYMPEYINELIVYLKESAGLERRIYFEKELDEIYLDVSQAVPLGLILNEAITNAIKHGYPGHTTGIIRVSFNKCADGRNLLVIKDHGPGLPAGFDLERIDSLGMNLMRGLSKQLRGKFEIRTEGGVTILISFATEEIGLTGRIKDKGRNTDKVTRSL